MRIKLVFPGIFLFTILGCLSDKSSLDNSDLAQEIDNILSEWEFNCNVDVRQWGRDSVLINLAFQEKQGKTPSFFLDTGSNEIISRLLLFQLYQKIIFFKKIKILMVFQGFPNEAKEFVVSEERLKILRTELNNTFVELSILAIKRLKYEGIVKLDSFIKYMSEKTEYFKFNGNIWDLLFAFSLSCENQGEYLCNSYFFTVFTSALDDQNNDLLSESEKSTLREWRNENKIFSENQVIDLDLIISTFKQKYNFDAVTECL